MAHDVFISHSSKNKAIGDAVCAVLESEGIRCWIAPRDVTPGLEFGECIIEAIEQTRIMVLVFTADANASPQVRKEIERAVSHGVTILNWKVEDVVPGRALEFFISNVHWIDAVAPPLEAHLSYLAGTVKMLLARLEPQDAALRSSPVHAAADARPKLEKAEPARIQGSKLTPPEGPPMWPSVAADEPSQPTDHKREPAAQTVTSPASLSLHPPAEDPSAASSPESKKPAVRRVWPRTTLGVAAGLIVLLVVFYFGIRHGKRSSAVSQVGQTVTVSEPNASEQANAPISSPSSPPISAISTSPSQTAPPPAVGQTAAPPEPNAGEHWNALGSGTKTRLASIFGTNDGKRLWAVGDKGTILESDDGQHWIARNSGTSEHLDWIFGTGDGNHLWAAGESGTILQLGDGEHWNALSSGTKSRLISIFATSDGNRLWAVGDKGTILESGDGQHWIARNSGTSNQLATIFGTGDGNRLWAVGDKGTILESDGGEHWNALSSGTSEHLDWIFGTSDGNRQWAVGEKGTILESDDGVHWLARASGTPNRLYSIFGTSDGKRLWAVGRNGTILESGDGQHWIARNSGTSNQLATIFGTGDGNRLWAVGDKGTILESDNGKN